MLFASKVNNDTADIKSFPRSWRAVDNSKPSAPIYGQIREDSEASLLFTELKWHEISTLAFCILTDAHALLWIVIRVWRQSYPVFLPSRIWLPHYTSGVNPPTKSACAREKTRHGFALGSHQLWWLLTNWFSKSSVQSSHFYMLTWALKTIVHSSDVSVLTKVVTDWQTFKHEPLHSVPQRQSEQSGTVSNYDAHSQLK